MGNTGHGQVNENATRCLAEYQDPNTGFSGPAFYGNVTQIVVFRARKAFNSLGVTGPVVDIAIVDVAGDSSITWVSRLFGEGLQECNRQGANREAFDLDFRDPDVDGLKAVAAGYMMLGQWSSRWEGSFTQFRGAIHALELHSAALSDRAVLDVVANLRTWMDPTIAPHPACEPCSAGTFDRDTNQATECKPCDAGRFSSAVGATVCDSTCAIGTTVRQAGAASASSCTLCPAGRYGTATNDDTTICSPCERGRMSAAAGAESGEACGRCPSGQSSGVGWESCEPAPQGVRMCGRRTTYLERPSTTARVCITARICRIGRAAGSWLPVAVSSTRTASGADSILMELHLWNRVGIISVASLCRL